jgi:hypothetical protein
VIAAGYNGYGGSYANAAGNLAAEMATTNLVPDLIPDEIFSPRRFLSDDPLFLTERKGLWQVAASLCGQLKAVNRQISEALTLQRAATFDMADSAVLISRPAGRSRSAKNIEPQFLRAFALFNNFSDEEAGELLRLMRRWDLPKDSVIFTEGSSGGTCYMILDGAVDVSTNTHGRQQLLAILEAGSVFGQVSVFDDVGRSATCSVRTDAVLLEIERRSCERLLRSGSVTAMKLLATLNEGLIAALRGADLRLMQLDRQDLVVD